MVRHAGAVGDEFAPTSALPELLRAQSQLTPGLAQAPAPQALRGQCAVEPRPIFPGQPHPQRRQFAVLGDGEEAQYASM